MSIRNLIFSVNSVTDSYLICYDSLLENATDAITKCKSYFITKRDKNLLQNASRFLLQNATVLLQNVPVFVTVQGLHIVIPSVNRNLKETGYSFYRCL